MITAVTRAAVVIQEQVTIGAITEGTGADYRRDMLNLGGLRRL